VRAPIKVHFVIVGMLALGIGVSKTTFAQEPPAPPPVLNNHELRHKYVWDALGPAGALHATLVGGFDQWRRDPPEWSSDTKGYSQRWASAFASSAIGSTTKYAVARVLHQDPSFTRCECTGTGPRLRHALEAPFTARTRDGRRVLSPATVAGLTAENVVPASTWYPARRGVEDGVLHAAFGVVSKMGIDTFREFVPWPRRRPASK
jgi:hypothetical protein